jgi:hypothetical protein
MSEQEESDNRQDEPVESKKKSEQKSDSTSKKCSNSEDCNGCSDCKHENDAEDLKNSASAEFIEDLERKWTTDDELSHIEEMMDRKEQNPKRIFKSLKKKIFNFR